MSVLLSDPLSPVIWFLTFRDSIVVHIRGSSRKSLRDDTIAMLRNVGSKIPSDTLMDYKVIHIMLHYSCSYLEEYSNTVVL